MKVRWIQPDTALACRRGEVVVCIPVFGGHEPFVSCLRSVLTHTAATVPILVCDDASPDARSQEFVRRLEDAASTEHEILYLRRERNLGFPANVNGAFALAAPADLVIVNSDCAVGAGWLEGLRDAVYSDSRVATATALTNNGTIVSVPHRGRPEPRLPEGWALDEAAAAVRAGSLRLRPRLPTAVGHCLYVRRSALELVGDFDLAFTPGYGEEVDFAQRCLHRGLSHVLADDVFVFHSGGASFSAGGGARSPIQDRHERVIAARYPYYHDAVAAVEDDVAGPLARALSAARRALGGLSVLIDARVVAGPMTGTQLQVLEVISALARAGTVRLSVVVSSNVSRYAAAHLAGLPGVRMLTRPQLASDAFERVDLVHRPYQINHDEDLVFLAGLGERLVVTNQDLIGYHNPAYFENFEKWQGYRRITRSALAVADHVVFVSAHARDDALSDDMLEPARASVVHNGVDHSIADGSSEPVAPAGAARLPAGAEAILCLGTDFRHKNRVFALRLLEALRERGWPGYLVLAGPHVTEGSSRPDEAMLLASRAGLDEAVIELAAVSEAEKVWLFQRCRLVLYPTVHEGFGLVPFEAADHGVPCLWAASTSLAEVLPTNAAQIVMWSAAETAANALRLLSDPAAREANLAAIRGAAAGLTWDAAAARLTEIYHLTCAEPATPASSLERRHGLSGLGLSEDAMRLIGPGGALPADVERPLLALATHRQIGAPMFRAMKLGYRASFALRRRRGRATEPTSGRS